MRKNNQGFLRLLGARCGAIPQGVPFTHILLDYYLRLHAVPWGQPCGVQALAHFTFPELSLEALFGDAPLWGCVAEFGALWGLFGESEGHQC
jgi:hypothetical protein